MDFVASLVGSVAWPVSFVVAVLVFREQLVSLLSGQLQRLKAGPLEMEFFERVAVLHAELDTGFAELRPGYSSIFTDSLGHLAITAPAEAVLQAHEQLEGRLRQLLRESGYDPEQAWGMRRLVGEAHTRNLVSDELARVVDGVTVLRNLAAHGHARDLSSERASEYLALMDTILYSLDTPS